MAYLFTATILQVKNAIPNLPELIFFSVQTRKFITSFNERENLASFLKLPPITINQN